jgi:hypothetical protein
MTRTHRIRAYSSYIRQKYEFSPKTNQSENSLLPHMSSSRSWMPCPQYNDDKQHKLFAEKPYRQEPGMLLNTPSSRAKNYGLSTSASVLIQSVIQYHGEVKPSLPLRASLQIVFVLCSELCLFPSLAVGVVLLSLDATTARIRRSMAKTSRATGCSWRQKPKTRHRFSLSP